MVGLRRCCTFVKFLLQLLSQEDNRAMEVVEQICCNSLHGACTKPHMGTTGLANGLFHNDIAILLLLACDLNAIKGAIEDASVLKMIHSLAQQTAPSALKKLAKRFSYCTMQRWTDPWRAL